MKGKILLALTLSISAVLPVPAAADPITDAVAATAHTPNELLATFDEAILPGLGPIGPPPSITGDPILDDRIGTRGEARGYQRRPDPSVPLVPVDGRLLQLDAAAAWEGLQASAAAAGHQIMLTSAYRSSANQAAIFRSRLTGTSDEHIDAVLVAAAVPGYSRHHTGYAIDVRTPDAILADFGLTDVYAWLAADNWAAAKAHGWIPSYPDGADSAGPDPEPWEFVWVGAINIICGDFEVSEDQPFCDTVGSTFAGDIDWLHDAGITTGCREIRFCTHDHISRAQAATMLWRMAGEPARSTIIPFTDVPDDAYFTEAVRWMVELGITTGTSPDQFSPHDDLSRAQFVTFLWRFAGEPDPAGAHPFVDVADTSFATDAISWAAENAVTTGTSPEEFSPDATATRGQAAAFLHRFDSLS